MPAKAPSKKSTGMTKAEIEKLFLGREGKKFMKAIMPFLPGGAAAAAVSKGTKALVAKEQEAMRWKTGKKSKTVELKKGGKVKKRAKGGGVKK